MHQQVENWISLETDIQKKEQQQQQQDYSKGS